MEETRVEEPADDEIDLGEYSAIFRKIWWKVGLLSVAVGVITLIVMRQMPNLYEATAVITPSVEEGRRNPALTMFGIDVGGPSKVEDLETLFKSNDLTVRVFGKFSLWPIVMGDRYDTATGMMKMSWRDRLLGKQKEAIPPGDWDAIRIAEKNLRISVNRKAGTVSVSFESTSNEASARIVSYYLEEGKSRLQEEALERAKHNKDFIVAQISKTVDPLTRDRLYTLFGQEVEREMLARNREQFGFRVIDAARAPDRKSRPQRAKTAVLATILSCPVWTVLFGIRARRRRPEMSPGGSEVPKFR